MTAFTPFVSDADLHGLVDGHLDLSRRADVLKRIAQAPVERARVEAWQDQTDVLRSAFGAVAREPLPATLDLSPKPRLRCVSNELAPIPALPVSASGSARQRVFAGLGLVVALSIGSIWYIVAIKASDMQAVDLRPRGQSVDEVLRLRTAAALGDAPETRTGLPTLTIPDLAAAGFILVGAETQSSEPASLLFRYRNAASETLVISVARGGASPSRPSAQAGDVYSWRSRDNTFAMAGTIKPDRLRAIATALQSDDAP